MAVGMGVGMGLATAAYLVCDGILWLFAAEVNGAELRIQHGHGREDWHNFVGKKLLEGFGHAGLVSVSLRHPPTKCFNYLHVKFVVRVGYLVLVSIPTVLVVCLFLFVGRARIEGRNGRNLAKLHHLLLRHLVFPAISTSFLFQAEHLLDCAERAVHSARRRAGDVGDLPYFVRLPVHVLQAPERALLEIIRYKSMEHCLVPIEVPVVQLNNFSYDLRRAPWNDDTYFRLEWDRCFVHSFNKGLLEAEPAQLQNLCVEGKG